MKNLINIFLIYILTIPCYAESIKIEKHGNTCCLSVITLTCGNNEVLTTWFDRFKLENAVSEWFRNIGLKELEVVR